MNKYQEALENVKEVAKWQRNIYIRYGYICGKDIEALEELVDKATPKKPISKAMDGFSKEVASHLVCSGCNKPITNVWSKVKHKPRYCHYCGQALDWSDEE